MDIGKARDIQNPAAPWPDTPLLHRLHETNKMEDVSSTETEEAREDYLTFIDTES
jgi:hypothetical protein